MPHEYKCPDCGRIVEPVPFIGDVSDDAKNLKRKFVCNCGTVFLVPIQLDQHSLSDFSDPQTPQHTDTEN